MQVSNFKFKKAFTLVELLVALGVIAILSAILIPIVFHAAPNQNAILAKRAYYTVQAIVLDMTNDERCYPDRSNLSGNEYRYGLNDSDKYPNCLGYSGTGTGSGNACEKFSSIFNTILNAKSNSQTSYGTETAQGVHFNLEKDCTLAPSKTQAQKAYVVVAVDVNGYTKSPNCYCNTSSSCEGLYNENSKADCSKLADNELDEFRLKVYANGKIEILDQWAKDIVTVDTGIIKR